MHVIFHVHSLGCVKYTKNNVYVFEAWRKKFHKSCVLNAKIRSSNQNDMRYIKSFFILQQFCNKNYMYMEHMFDGTEKPELLVRGKTCQKKD